jgi:hypothetical protein
MTEAEFTMVRSAIAVQFPRPSITVVSAHKDDGRAYVSHGIADSFSRVGLRTALVALDAASLDDSSSDEVNAKRNLRIYEFSTRSMQKNADFQSFHQNLRSRFDVVVYCGDVGLNNESTVQAAMNSDILITSVRLGRCLDHHDSDILSSIQIGGFNLFCVVPTTTNAAKYRIPFDRRTIHHPPQRGGSNQIEFANSQL